MSIKVSPAPGHVSGTPASSIQPAESPTPTVAEVPEPPEPPPVEQAPPERVISEEERDASRTRGMSVHPGQRARLETMLSPTKGTSKEGVRITPGDAAGHATQAAGGSATQPTTPQVAANIQSTSLTDDQVRAARATVPQAMQQAPSTISVHNRPFTVYGATQREQEIIAASLQRIPPGHINTLPGTLVVADQIPGRGGPRHSGGATAMGNHPAESDRIHLTTLSLNPDPRNPHSPSPGYRPLTSDDPPLSYTLLHEAGHAVEQSGRNARGGTVGLSQFTMPDFEDLEWSGPDSRQYQEQFAQAYMHYCLGDLPAHQVTAMNNALGQHPRATALNPHPSVRVAGEDNPTP